MKRKRKSAFQKLKKSKSGKKKVEIEQRRRNLTKGAERLKLVTSKITDHERYREGTGRGFIAVQVLKIAFTRLAAYGPTPFPGTFIEIRT